MNQLPLLSRRCKPRNSCAHTNPFLPPGQARVAKKWSQKDLSTLINEKAQIVQQYEQGGAIPNPQIIQKLERALNCRLPRPGKAPKAAPPPGSTASLQKGVRDNQGLTPGQRAALTRGGPAGRR